ncbi:glycosyltransferase family 87 protein [Streptomyces albipurpureus]|uniref:Glycosyltransferase 87 family protein n=1 Tax=Streptomyces albipurpureus TaxID=2897419 RepID=A0ABT0UV36_9ACTN|nr:glycosyltransferase family 87 protein [Streptomyces sp. CWNU-1]MCM2392309.1 glycosyltransferase 87 family protein [Streptomyces sp. CWNU-1]
MTLHRIAPLPVGHPLSLGPRKSRPARIASRRTAALVGGWTATRIGMVILLLIDQLGDSGVAGEVHTLYRTWYEQLIQGAFPLDDPTWQYPPGAALVFLSPALLPWLTYFQAFVVVILLADAVITLALARAGVQGAWLWVGGLPLLLNLPLARYDVPVTAVAVLALLAARRHPRTAGALAGIGAMIKVWPLLTVLGAPPGRTTRAVWTSAAASAAALLIVLGWGFSHALSFLRQQGDRGVQIESLGGTALQLARQAGWKGEVRFQYGAFELVGPYVTETARLSLVLSALALGWLLLWRVRARHWTSATALDAAFAAVLLFTVTSRVISPQYLVWLLGLAAVCLTSRATTQRPVALLILPAAALSALAFPLLYEDVVAGTPLGCALMVLRNGLLLGAALVSCRRLWGASTARQGASRRSGHPL